jgi:hypothetical protein
MSQVQHPKDIVIGVDSRVPSGPNAATDTTKGLDLRCMSR